MRRNLKLLRVKYNLSQQELADAVGFTRQTYQAIESGHRRGTEEFWESLQTRFNIPDSEMWGLMHHEED